MLATSRDLERLATRPPIKGKCASLHRHSLERHWVHSAHTTSFKSNGELFPHRLTRSDLARTHRNDTMVVLNSQVSGAMGIAMDRLHSPFSLKAHLLHRINADELHLLLIVGLHALDVAGRFSERDVAQLPGFLKFHSLLPC